MAENQNLTNASQYIKSVLTYETLDNGLVIKVPLFIAQGEKVLVTTEDGKYSSRA